MAASVLPIEAVAGAGDSGETLAGLRLEVEALSSGLTAQRAELAGALAGLRAEREQLERELRQARARHETLVRIEREHAARSERLAAARERWHAPAQQALERVRAYVDAALPFALEERRRVLDRLALELAGSSTDVAHTTERLWRFLEEEAAMGREVALARHAITLAEAPELALELRIGMALLYFRTLDGRFGWARRGPEGWRFEAITDADGQAIVRELFARHERNEGFGQTDLLVPRDAATGEPYATGPRTPAHGGTR